MTPPKAPNQPGKVRPENTYKQAEPVHDWDKLREVLNRHAAAWEKWGKDVLSELDALEGGGKGDGGPGNPPTDASQPPKPPFK
jgi:hypothetical protein